MYAQTQSNVECWPSIGGKKAGDNLLRDRWDESLAYRRERRLNRDTKHHIHTHTLLHYFQEPHTFLDKQLYMHYSIVALNMW